MTRSVFTEKYKFVRHFLAEAREKKGYSQRELSKELKMVSSFVNKYESGERRLDIVEVVELCKLLDVDACHLVRDLQTMKTNETIIGKKI